MTITYYGTGAGGGIPEIFCSCRVCEEARKNRGKDIRTRSQAVLNEDLVIDYPVDVRQHMVYGGLDMRKYHNLIVTHSHYDHFMHQELFSRPWGANEAFNIYVTEASSVEAMKVQAAREEAFASGKRVRTDEMEIKFHIIKPYEPFEFLHYRVTAVRAHHAPGIDAVNFIIEDKDSGKLLFWGHDTGLLTKEVKQYLVENFAGRAFDFVSLDCTLERGNCITAGHMDLDRCLETFEWMRENRLAGGATKVAISHIGHLVKRTHAELEAEAGEYGIITAYNGMTLEF